MNKLKGFVRYTNEGRMVPGSAILSKKAPKDGNWLEIDVDGYYSPTKIDGMRAFVALNRLGQVIPTTNIFSKSMPRTRNWKEIYACYCASAITTTTTTTTTTEFTVEYGLLYNWNTVNDERNLANTGWHVPSTTDFQTMIDFCGGNLTADRALREVGWAHWEMGHEFGEGLDTHGFHGRGSGERGASDGLFYYLKVDLQLWTSTKAADPGTYAYMILISGDQESIPLSLGNPHEGKAIRLVKDSTTLTDGQTGTYTGNDGKVYNTICIGTQEWLSEALCETLYRNSDSIPEVTDNSAWAALSTGALCAYNNDWANAFTL